jgi:hypothetical protein
MAKLPCAARTTRLRSDPPARVVVNGGFRAAFQKIADIWTRGGYRSSPTKPVRVSNPVYLSGRVSQAAGLAAVPSAAAQSQAAGRRCTELLRLPVEMPGNGFALQLFCLELRSPRPISRECLDPAPALLLRCPRARHTAAPKISGLGSFMLLIKDCLSPWSPKVTPGTGRRKANLLCIFYYYPGQLRSPLHDHQVHPRLEPAGAKGEGGDI